MKFIAAMVINPDVQAKAQKEIDSVVGPDTFPRMSDRDRLPYVRNLISEVLRWHTVSPVGRSWCGPTNKMFGSLYFDCRRSTCMLAGRYLQRIQYRKGYRCVCVLYLALDAQRWTNSSKYTHANHCHGNHSIANAW
jgi:hypothetical protein